MTLKYYIATSLKRIPHHNLVRDFLNQEGHQLTYDWSMHGRQKKTSLERLQEIGEREVNAIKKADVVIILLPGGKGTHTELGLSIALNKPVFLHSQTQEPFELGEAICAFYCLPSVSRICCSFEAIQEPLSAFFHTNTLLNR